MEGKDYYFSDLATMRGHIDNSQYLEHGYVLGSRVRPTPQTTPTVVL